MVTGTAVPECEIDGIRYPLAVEQSRVLFNVIQAGKDLEAIFNDWRSGMGITRDIGLPGYFFSHSIDATEYGQLRLIPTAVGTASGGGSIDAYGWFFEALDGSGNKYVYLCHGANVLKYSFDGLTLHSTVTFAGTAGRTAKWQSKNYIPFGDGNNARRLDTVAVGAAADTWADAGWQAISLMTYQELGIGKIARGVSTNHIGLAASAGDIAAGDWSDAGTIGDTTSAITDLAETQGFLYVAKTDNLYEFDSNHIARPIITVLNRGNVDADNGKGTHAFGDIIFYPCTQGLWRYRIGSSARPIGPDTIRTFSHTVNGPSLTIPMHFRSRTVVSSGEFIYHWVSGATLQALLQARLRGDDDPPGHEMVWHTLALPTAPSGIKGAFVDSANKLWHHNALASNHAYIQLDQAGGTMDSPREDVGGSIYMPETDLGEPFANKEWRVIGADIENIGSATVDLRHNLDGAADTTVGATISSSGVTERTFPAATRGYRLRPIVRINVSVASQDPRVLKVRVKARKAQVYQVVIPADTPTLDGYGLTEYDVRNNLSRLVDQGFVNFLEPGRIDTWAGEVKSLTTVNYQNGTGTFGKGIQLTVERFTSD